MRRIIVIFLVLGGLFYQISALSAGGKQPASSQQAKTFEGAVREKVKLNYLLFLPQGYDEADKKWPLILFLHGAGERGDNINLVKKHGPPKIVETKKDFPFIVVSPQSPDFGWDVVAVNALLGDVLKNYNVDPDRVYLTGLSMGGYGTWEMAGRYPDRFAAIVPICGGGSRIWTRRLSDMPIWVFHGAKDTAVPLEESERLVNALKKKGSKVRFTIYPDAGHDSWTETYNNPELYEWLLQQRRKK